MKNSIWNRLSTAFVCLAVKQINTSKKIAVARMDEFNNPAAAFNSGYTENTIARGGVPGEDIVFIQKPVRLGMLSRKIREVLDSGSG